MGFDTNILGALERLTCETTRPVDVKICQNLGALIQ